MGTTGSRAAGKESRGRSWMAAGRGRGPKISTSDRESDILSNLSVTPFVHSLPSCPLYQGSVAGLQLKMMNIYLCDFICTVLSLVSCDMNLIIL